MSDPARQYQQILSQLNEDPEFKKLGYKAQTQVRAQIASQALSQMPEFQKMHPQYRQRVIEEAAVQPPALENEEIKRYYADAMAKIQRGEDSGLPVGLAMFGGAHSLLKYGHKFAQKVLPDAITQDLENKNLTWESQYGPDAQKVYQYDIAKNPGKSNAALAGSILGTISDIVSYNLLVSPATRGVAALGEARAAGLAGKGIRSKRWLNRVAMPQAIESSMEGLFGVAREKTLNTGMADNLSGVAKTFGLYALEDYVTGAALMTAFPFLRSSTKKVFGRRKRGVQDMPRTEQEFNDLLKQVEEGHVSPEKIAQIEEADPITADALMGRAQVKEIVDNRLDDIDYNPGDLGQFHGHNLGVITRRFDTGEYRVTRLTDKGYDQTNHPNALSMNKQLGEIAEEQLGSIKKGSDEAKAFEQTYRPLLMYHRAGKATDYTFDPARSPNAEDLEAGKLEKAKRSKRFVSPIDRQYISSIEAENIRKRNAYSGYVDFEPGESTVKAIKEGGPIFDPGTPRQFNKVSKSRAFYSFDNPAMGEELAQANQKAAKAIEEGSEESFETLQAKYLMEGGYDGAITPDGKIITPYPEKIKVIADNVDPATGKPLKVDPKGRAIKTRAMVEDTVREKVSAKEFSGKKKAVAESLAKVKGDMMDNRQYVADISETYLKGTGSEVQRVNVFPARGVKETTAVDFSEGSLSLRVPEKIDTFGKQKKFIDELVGELNKYAGEGGIKGTFSNVLSKSPSKFDMPFSGPMQERWLMSIAREDFGATARKVGDEIHLRIDDRNMVFGSSNELGDYLLYRSIDESMLSKLLADEGYVMRGSKKKGYTVSGPDGVVARGSTAKEIMDVMDWKPDKLPNTFAPKNVVVGDGDIVFDFDRSTILGSKKQVLQTLDRFADYSQDSQFKIISSKGDTAIERSQIGQIRVKVPEAGIVEYFDDLNAAKKFLNEDLDTFDGLKNQAKKKGLHFSALNGQFYLTDGIYRYDVGNLDEVKEVLKQYPDPDGARSILSSMSNGGEIEEAVSQYVGGKMKRQNPLPKGEDPPDLFGTAAGNPPGEPEGAPTLGFLWNVKRVVSRTAEVMESAARKSGNDAAIRYYRETERMARLSDSDINKTSKLIASALTDKSGKILPLASRRKIYYIGGAQNDDEYKKAVEMFGELTAEERRSLDQIRDILGKDEYSGLYFKFNVGGRKISGSNFINNYLPRIRRWMTEADNNDLAKIVDAEDLANRVWGKGNVPNEVRFFAENERASELLNMAVDDDIYSVLQKYSYKGHRKLYLDPMIRKWNRIFKDNPDIPDEFRYAVNSYLERLLGSKMMPDEQVASDIGRAIYQGLGKTSVKEQQEGAKLYKKLFTLNYATNLAWRPYLAVRNTYQIWTTLASRVGNDTVSRAVRAIERGDEDVYNFLKENGIIRDKPPILNDIEETDSLLNKYTEKGLSWFQDSDEYTRGVAFLASKIQMDEAVEASRKGVISSDWEFSELAGLNKVSPDVKNEVMRFVKRGGDANEAAAREIYGNHLVEETMFGYRKSESPALFRGFIGKMFGQYGTFSAGYRANLAHGLRYGSFKDKAGFLARFVGNQIGLWAGLGAIGINADDFIPFAPAIFGGGPLFGLTVDMLKGMNPNSYEGAESRRRLAEAFSPIVRSGEGGVKFNYPDLLPGALHYHYMETAFEHMKNDEYFRSFLAMTGTPTVQSTSQ